MPHFHAVSPDFDFKIAMDDCTVISGTGTCYVQTGNSLVTANL